MRARPKRRFCGGGASWLFRLCGAYETICGSRADCAKTIGQHVLLGIPDVALGAKEKRARLRISHCRIAPFDQLEDGGEAEDAHHGQQAEQPSSAYQVVLFQIFQCREGE